MRAGLVFAIGAIASGGCILGASLMLFVPGAAIWAMRPVELLCRVGLNHKVAMTLLAIMPAYIVFLGPMVLMMRRRAAARAGARRPGGG